MKITGKTFVSFIFLISSLLIGCHSEAYTALENEVSEARVANAAKALETEGHNAEEEKVPAVAENKPPDLTNIDNWGEIPMTLEAEKHTPVTDWDGISSSTYMVYGNKYYYVLKAKKTIPSPYGRGHNTGALVTRAYTNLITLESNYLCPDPLCKHNDLNTCMYIDWSTSAPFCIADKNTCYAVKRDYKDYKIENGKFKVYKLDLSANKVKAVYTPIDDMPSFIGSENGIVYIWDSKSTKNDDEKTVILAEYIIGLSIETDEIVYKRKLPEDCRILLIRNGRILYNSTKALVECNMNFENARILFEYSGNETMGTWYYDENLDEFWFSIINNNSLIGKIYKIGTDGNSEEIHLPSNKIYCFQLTNSKIYYSEYSPRYLGEHPFAPEGTIDYSGGQIFMVDRKNPGENPILAYDTQGKYFLCLPGVFSYSIFGDQMFLPLAELLHEVVNGRDCVYISVAFDMPMARIDLTTGEEEIIRFE